MLIIIYYYRYTFLIKSHLQSYPSPNNINSFWNMGFLLIIIIILQIITGILLALHYTPDINYAYYSVKSKTKNIIINIDMNMNIYHMKDYK